MRRRKAAAVRLTWSTGTTVTSYIVYRDGVPIAETTAKTYTDYYSNGDTVYLVRGVLSTGYYVDSLALTVPVRMPCDVLSPVEGVSWIYLRYSLSPLSRAYDKSVDISYKYYAGPDAPAGGHGRAYAPDVPRFIRIKEAGVCGRAGGSGGGRRLSLKTATATA